jgi:hypothetical protein
LRLQEKSKVNASIINVSTFIEEKLELFK